MPGWAPEPAAGDPAVWHIRGRTVDLGRPVVVGVLNVTPDSFSDGGVYLEPAAAEERALSLAAEGADLIDIGAESTRPGAPAVPADEEWDRLAPVLERLRRSLAVPLSVDTTKAIVAERALELGAAVINDVSGLEVEPRIGRLAAESGAGLVLMHRRGDPRTMQRDVEYADLIAEVRASLERSIDAAVSAGCSRKQLVVDPGICFGKSPEGSLRLLAEVGKFGSLDVPIMVGPSRKSFIGMLLDLPVHERLEATIGACVVALERGARLFRVHDVGPARRALDLAEAIRRAGAAEDAPAGAPR
jgi:dihydropteroate synthase